MPALIRILLIILLAAKWTFLLAESEFLHGLLVTVITAVLTYNLWSSYRWSTLIVTILSSLLMLTISGEHIASSIDIEILMTSALLMLALATPIEGIIQGYGLAAAELGALIAVIATPLLMSLWLVFQANVTVAPKPLTSTNSAKHQFNLVVQAIGGKEQKQSVTELEARFGLPESDTWKNGLGSNIPESGPWPLYIFFSELPDDGSAITQDLWGKAVDALQIANIQESSLQPLLNCRNAIRGLFSKVPQYTPFFQMEDFGDANNSLMALEDKVYGWAKNNASDVKECKDLENTQITLHSWIENCFKKIQIENTSKNYSDFQNIKTFVANCEKMPSITQN